jgi:Protein of unknown function (DUF3304)
MMNRTVHTLCALLAALVVMCGLSACAQAQAPQTQPRNQSDDRREAAAPAASAEPVESRLAVEARSLLIQGYNYTDDYIDSFTVDGQGGGNLYVSGPSSGGGGSVCCASFIRGTPMPVKLKVRWSASYCMVYETNVFGRTSSYRKGLWKEAEALLVDLSQGKPRALEVHIFPDGHVEAAITPGYSRPRLVLPDDHRGLRPGVQHTYPDCTDEQLKQNQP